MWTIKVCKNNRSYSCSTCVAVVNSLNAPGCYRTAICSCVTVWHARPAGQLEQFAVFSPLSATVGREVRWRPRCKTRCTLPGGRTRHTGIAVTGVASAPRQPTGSGGRSGGMWGEAVRDARVRVFKGRPRQSNRLQVKRWMSNVWAAYANE